ncbi:MAG: efflux RND transporter periplasmic adaptor subunit [Acetobacteraceae bacterium]|nr:efflux RND transporter periplasmic adaptor subunit [Acetobacteraceae bacterium]
MTFRVVAALLTAMVLAGFSGGVRAQAGPGGPPPAVGVVRAEKKAITETSEFIGRVQAIDRVDLTARVTAFVHERLFTEGSEVQAGDQLYRLERAPFEAAVQQQAAAVAQSNAQLANANIQLARAQALLNTPAGQKSTVDDARANQLSQSAQLMSAQAQLRAAQINLDYTEIRAPVNGKISQTRFTVGNVVSPSSGALATIVSQDPMYVSFPISVRTELEIGKRYMDRGGVNAMVVRLRLPDGSMYNQQGKIDYIEPTVSANTDTILIRAKIPNPKLGPDRPGEVANRMLTDGEFVTVLVEGVEPIVVLGVPRAAVLSDQQGNYVFVVNSQNRVEQRRIQLGQSTPETAVITSGLKEGEMVIAEGIQRVRPGIQVTPGPAYPGPAGGATAQAGGASPQAASGTTQTGSGTPQAGGGTSQTGSAAPGAQASGGGNGPAAAAATSPSTPAPTSGSPAGAAAGSAGSAGTSSGH